MRAASFGMQFRWRCGPRHDDPHGADIRRRRHNDLDYHRNELVIDLDVDVDINDNCVDRTAGKLRSEGERRGCRSRRGRSSHCRLLDMSCCDA